MKQAKREANLKARQEDWEKMTARVDFKAPEGAYKKPGSVKK